MNPNQPKQRAAEQRIGRRSSALISGPMRHRSTSQRRLPGSHTPQATLDDMRQLPWAADRDQAGRSSLNSTGPTRSGGVG